MKRSLVLITFLAFLFWSFTAKNEKSTTNNMWGFFGHKKINRLAVFTLPPEMFSFYKEHIEFLTEHAVDPDKRRYATEGEAPRHYIDIDHYAHGGVDPFTVMPQKWNEAVEKYTEDTIQAYGIVPWHVQVMVGRLTKAFKDQNFDKILRYSAELGHYVGDACVPLHTTENYNGQMTGQRGIHGFWESRCVELFSEDYDFFVGTATYVEDLENFVWKRVRESHYAVDSVLNFERKLTTAYPTDRKYAYDNRGNRTIKTYSREFSKEYETMLDGMIERRMRTSVISLGSLWYTAWLNGGKPDLNKINQKDISEELKKEIEEENKAFEQGGNIKGRSHDH